MPKIHRDRPPTNRFDVTSAPALPQEPAESSASGPPQMPARSARKPAWVAYAEAVGADSSGTKAQIIARVG